MKIQHKDIREIREHMLHMQDGVDPITNLPITDAVLDHDHETGRIRCVLQREINAFEGKVWNAFNRYCKHLGVSFEEALIGLIEYHQLDFSENPLHPKHMTPEDRLIREYRKRIRNAKRESTKQKYRDLIEQILQP